MRFTYVHFPKAGGTSLHTQLENHFPKRILYDYAHDPLAHPDARGGFDSSLDAWVGICGHFHPMRYDLRTDAILFTILREPIYNLISIYYFWCDYPRSGNPVHDRFLDERPNIEAFAMHYPLRNLMSEVYFGEYDMNRFDFIGFSEDRQRTFARVSELLAVPLDPEVLVNKTDDRHAPQRQDLLANPERMGRLRAALADDIRFYERMLAAHL